MCTGTRTPAKPNQDSRSKEEICYSKRSSAVIKYRKRKVYETVRPERLRSIVKSFGFRGEVCGECQPVMNVDYC